MRAAITRLSEGMRFLSPSAVHRRAPFYAMGALYIYLGYHALSGSQGLVRWMEFEDQTIRLEAKLDSIKARRAALQGEVDRLSASGLDLDSLDIEARRTLFVAKREEVTIWLDPADP